MWYVIDLVRKETVAQSHNRADCITYIRNVRTLFNNHHPMTVVKGSQVRDKILNRKES